MEKVKEVKELKHREIWPTTLDNPFDPFTQWDRWYSFDKRAGYNTCELLAKLARNSTDLAECEQEEIFNNAICKLFDLFEPKVLYRIAVKGKEQKF